MDPLSVTASIIALAQAVGAVKKGIQFLNSLRNISESLRGLSNELEAVLTIVEQVLGALDEVKALNAEGITAGNPASAAGQHRDVLDVVKLQANSLEQAANDLRALCARIVGEPTSAIKANGAKRRAILRTTTWMREKSQIEPIYVRMDSARKHLSLCLESINTTLLSRQTRTSHEVQQSIHMAITGIIEIKSETQSTQMTMTRLEDGISQTTAMMSEMMRMMQIQTIQAPSLPLGIGSSGTPGTVLPEESPAREPTMSASDYAGATVPYRYDEDNDRQPENNESTYLIDTIIRTKMCLPSCPCRCHQRVHTGNRYRMSSIFGSLFVNYNSLPIVDPRPCNIASCVGHTRSLMVRYIFPQWMMARAFFLAASWGSLTGAGCDLHLQVPRVIHPDVESQLRQVFIHDDIDGLKLAISTKLLFSNSVFEHRRGVIAQSLKQKGPFNEYLVIKKVKFIRFLVEQGFSTTLGASKAGGKIRQLLYRGDARRMYPLFSIALRFDAEAPTSSTLIHDILFGISDVPLSYALKKAPWDVNSWGCIGETPMHTAIRMGDLPSLKAMTLLPECDIKAKDGVGTSLVGIAVRSKTTEHIKICRLLLEAGANVNSTSLHGTPIFQSTGNPELTQLLLSYGASTTSGTNKGISNPLLFECSESGGVHSEAERRSFECLIDAGLDIDMTDRDGRTSFAWAVQHAYSRLVAWLLEWGAKVATVDHRGQSILHFVYPHGHKTLKILDVLTSIPRSRLQGLDPDAKDVYGRSPMDMLEADRHDSVSEQGQEYRFRSFLDEIRAINRAAGICFSNVEELLDEDEDGDDEYADADEFVDAPEYL